MRFHWKLLILLVVVALIPIVSGRLFGVEAVNKFGHNLEQRAAQKYISDATRDLRLLVDAYATVLWEKRDKLEAVLRHQAWEVERLLASKPSSTAILWTSEVMNRQASLPPDAFPSATHSRTRADGSFDYVTLAGSTQVYHTAPGVDWQTVRDDAVRLAPLAPLFQEEAGPLGSLVFWRYVSLNNGLLYAYPAHEGIPADLEARQKPWHQIVLEHQEIHWTDRYLDPVTRDTVAAVSMPISDSAGNMIGSTSIVVPVEAFLHQKMLLQNILPGTHAYIVYIDQNEKTGQPGVRIFVSKGAGQAKLTKESVLPLDQWLTSSAKAPFDAMRKDIMMGSKGLQRMPYKGRDSLWVYDSLGHGTGYLVLVIPYETILEPVRKEKAYLDALTQRLIDFTGYVGAGALVIALILAFAFARTVTRPLAALASGANRLANGDFGTQVDIKARDEFGAVGAVFNAIGPRLKEHEHMRHSLVVAMEVQQNLMPSAAPRVSGLDIAGISHYCDETGGDYFDYLDPGTQKSSRIGVLVGDVTGHGIPSALLMTTARALLRQRAALGGRIDQVLTDVNHQLALDVGDSGRFMTLFYAEIDTGPMMIRWVRAGHEPAIVYDPVGDHFFELIGSGCALGIMEDTRYQQNKRELTPGQIILIGTDGIWETHNAQGDMLGKEAVQNILRNHADQPAQAIAQAVVDGVANFRGDFEQEDDVTLVVVKVLASAAD